MRIVDQGPVPAEGAWQVRWASDMGGAAGNEFVVVPQNGLALAEVSEEWSDSARVVEYLSQEIPR
jgi:hypothetical protein